MTDHFRQELMELLPRLRRFCRALAGDNDRAHDLAQDAVERALAKEDQWQPGTRMDSWLYRIAQNLWIDEMRRQKSRGPHQDIAELEGLTGTDGRRDFESRTMLQKADLALARLPEDQRATVVLVHVEGFSYRETAKTLGVSEGTVASRLARAKIILEQLLRED